MRKLVVGCAVWLLCGCGGNDAVGDDCAATGPCRDVPAKMCECCGEPGMGLSCSDPKDLCYIANEIASKQLTQAGCQYILDEGCPAIKAGGFCN